MVTKIFWAGLEQIVPVTVHILPKASLGAGWDRVAGFVLHVKANRRAVDVRVLGVGLVFDGLPLGLIVVLELLDLLLREFERGVGRYCWVFGRAGDRDAGNIIGEFPYVLSCQPDIPADTFHYF